MRWQKIFIRSHAERALTMVIPNPDVLEKLERILGELDLFQSKRGRIPPCKIPRSLFLIVFMIFMNIG